MGHNKKRGGRGGGRGGRGGRQAKDDTYRTDLLEKADMENERFVAYYKAQNIVAEDEWNSFLEALRQPLPTTFRVAGSRQTAHSLNETIKDNHVPNLSDASFEGQPIPPPVQIPWYPEGLAWQFNVPKKVLRKSPEFKKFHSFLVFETEVGNVSRQEAVSMLPPLFLDVEPHHKVMDMCAAPGSKTAQLLEALHADDTITSTSIPSGLLIANDSDQKRTHLLIHQSARLPSPALMVTNLDASNYPVIKIPADGGLNTNKRLEQLQFDRILCDVPCSGDGTIRKNVGIWKTWQPMDGNGLHGLQLRILQRAMKLLNDGGRIVYSTCSLNPVENEAVIASALKTNADFELVDVSTRFPALRRRPGLTIWRPTVDRSVTTTYSSYLEFSKTLSDPEASNSKMTEGHWPPSDAEELGLTRCLRIYPHLQDTGGFFVAVLQKKRVAEVDDIASLKERKRGPDESIDIPETKKPRLTEELKAQPSTNQPTDTAGDLPAGLEDVSMDDGVGSVLPGVTPSEPVSNKGKSKSKPSETGGSFKENPYTFLPHDDPILRSCIERLNLTSQFPSNNVLVRNPEGDAVRSLYLANDIVKSVIQHNDYNRIRLTAAGTKVFAKQEAGKGSDAQFRVLGEGLPVVLPYTDPTTIIAADIRSLKTLVESYYPLCASFGQPFRSTLEAKAAGSHIVRFPHGDYDDATLTHDVVLPIWKSNVSVTLMIDKKAKSALSLRLFGADITTAGRDSTHQRKPIVPTPKSGTPLLEIEDGDMGAPKLEVIIEATSFGIAQENT